MPCQSLDLRDAGIGNLPAVKHQEPAIGNAGIFGELEQRPGVCLQPAPDLGKQVGIHTLPHHTQFIAPTSSRKLRLGLGTIEGMLTAREIFAANLKALMASSDKFKKPETVAKNCYWLRGSKEGKKVSIRRIQQALDPREDIDPPPASPTVDLVEAVAATFGYEAWLLLVPSLNPRAPPELLIRGARSRGNGERPTNHVVVAKPNPQKRPKDRKSGA